MLSIGMPSTVGSYLKITKIFFGEESTQYQYIKELGDKSPNGENEEIIADEWQMMYLLANLE